MKKYILGTIILVIIAICTFISHQYTENVVESMNTYIERISNYLDDEDYSSAMNEVDAVKEKFEKSNSLLSIYTSHTKLDEITASINRLSAYLENENKNDSLAELRNIHARLQIIYNEEKISLENIL